VSLGGVIHLNGTSSAGKTTLAEAVIEQFAETGACWIVIGIDDYISRLPPAWHSIGDHVGPFADDGFTFDLNARGGIRIGPVGERLLTAYRSAVRGAAFAGLNVVVDDVAVGAGAVDAWNEALAGIDVLRVRVDADAAVKEAREATRGNRLVGLARAQDAHVHDGMRYDLAIDTGADDPASPARQVREAFSAMIESRRRLQGQG
jgi:chloramphenicol 3-O phosphotransferase